MLAIVGLPLRDLLDCRFKRRNVVLQACGIEVHSSHLPYNVCK